MIENFVSLIASFLPLFEYYLFFVFILCFVVSVPCLIKWLFFERC